MPWFFHALIFVGSFLMMEGVAWFTHKYIMHGFLWTWHKDHHVRGKGFFEWNDLFAVIFASVAITLIVLGSETFNWMFWMGTGITAYGIGYFLVHDVFVHQRFKLFRNANSRYAKALRRAHKIHHKTLAKHGAESFGFLWVAKKYWPKGH